MSFLCLCLLICIVVVVDWLLCWAELCYYHGVKMCCDYVGVVGCGVCTMMVLCWGHIV